MSHLKFHYLTAPGDGNSPGKYWYGVVHEDGSVWSAYGRLNTPPRVARLPVKEGQDPIAALDRRAAAKIRSGYKATGFTSAAELDGAIAAQRNSFIEMSAPTDGKRQELINVSERLENGALAGRELIALHECLEQGDLYRATLTRNNLRECLEGMSAALIDAQNQAALLERRYEEVFAL